MSIADRMARDAIQGVAMSLDAPRVAGLRAGAVARAQKPRVRHLYPEAFYVGQDEWEELVWNRSVEPSRDGCTFRGIPVYRVAERTHYQVAWKL